MSTNKLFLTGDTHREIDIHKLKNKALARNNINITENDYVLIAGDFGAVWDGTASDRYIQEWYNDKPWTTLFIDGNHENHALLDSYPIVKWHGGKVHMITPSIIHLMRGQIYNICGKTIFVMGGAESRDKIYRRENESWWAREMPSDSEYNEALENLDAHNNKVDIIVSHCAPDAVQDELCIYYEHNKLTNFLEIVRQTVDFKDWFCAHYHIDKDLKNYHVLYNSIIEV